MRQNLAVLTTSRAEYYQLRGILRRLQLSPILALQLFVSGTHLSPQFGRSEQHILSDGFEPTERLPILVDDYLGAGCALTAGLAVQTIGAALQRHHTDLLFLAGDRYETLAAGLAATCMGVPIAHLHGGERTEGAMDDACRHALTKLSALHFVSTEVYRARVIQMGEQPERVIVTGAPFLDQALATELLSEAEIQKILGLPLIHPIALVAYHPATLEDGLCGDVCGAILDSLAEAKTVILTAPNSDPGREKILETMEAFAARREGVALFSNLGSQLFLSVMAIADIMVGNSSSGIHEAASYGLPVVNVGTRQAGRLRSPNVLDCRSVPNEVRDTIAKAFSPEFHRSLQGMRNPYGDGNAGTRIIEQLESFVPFKSRLRHKTFQDNEAVESLSQSWSLSS